MIFEYALVHGVNADPAQAVELAGRLRGMQCHVNLIPLNSVPERGLTGVTEREVDVMRCIASGATVAETAERLFVSRDTVKKHLANVYAKLGVHSKMQAVALLRDEGVI